MVCPFAPLIFSYHTLFIARTILTRHERLIVKIPNNLACHNFLCAAIKAALPYKGKKNDGFGETSYDGITSATINYIYHLLHARSLSLIHYSVILSWRFIDKEVVNKLMELYWRI